MQKKEAVVYPLFSLPLMAVSLDIDNNKLLNHIKNITYRNNIHSDKCYLSESVKILENKKLKKELLAQFLINLIEELSCV